jgi:hypothetical protein
MQAKIQTATEKKSSQRTKAVKTTKPVRLCLQTKKKLDSIVARVNSARRAKKVKYDDIIAYLIDQLTPTQIDTIKQSFVSNTERFDAAFCKYRESKAKESKDDFLGFLLNNQKKESVNTSLDAN